MIGLSCRQLAGALLLCVACPASAQPQLVPLPPSPFGSDRHGVYDSVSQCWVWQVEAHYRPYPEAMDDFSTASHCQGKALEGPAKLTWHRGYTASPEESWDGQFHQGRFTGHAILSTPAGKCETDYSDARRNGRSVCAYNGGGREEQNYVDDQPDGPYLDAYADGTRMEGAFEKGQRVGLWIRTMRDGSRTELQIAPGTNSVGINGTLISADGARVPGVYAIARSDPSQPRPMKYPPISVRLGEQGVVGITFLVSEDGSTRDFVIARTSGSERLDQGALQQLATWHFRPATVDGKPIATFVIVHQDFHLREVQ